MTDVGLRPPREIVIVAPYEVAVRPYEPARPEGDELLVDVEYSGISTGTELSIVKGTNPRFETDTVGGVATPRAAPLRFPVRSMGYMEVGTVRESPADRSLVGERVALACGHRTEAVVRADGYTRLPAGIGVVQGIWVQRTLPICANALLHAAAELTRANDPDLGAGVRGRNVAVFGAGVVALVLASWAADSGAREVVVVDSLERRLAAASEIGLVPLATDGRRAAAAEIHASWRHGRGDTGADVVFQCRAAMSALGEALACVRPGHPIVDLAFYQTDAAGLRLGTDFHHAGLVLRAAQVGNLPRTFAGTWDRRRLVAEGLGFLERRGERLASTLVTDLVPLGEAPALLARLASGGGGGALQSVIAMGQSTAATSSRQSQTEKPILGPPGYPPATRSYLPR